MIGEQRCDLDRGGLGNAIYVMCYKKSIIDFEHFYVVADSKTSQSLRSHLHACMKYFKRVLFDCVQWASNKCNS